MLRLLNRLTWIVVAVAVLAGVSYGTHRYTESQQQVRKAQEQRERLQAIADRLASQRRAAEVMLIGRRSEQGIPAMDLLFVEYARGASTNSRAFRRWTCCSSSTRGARARRRPSGGSRLRATGFASMRG